MIKIAITILTSTLFTIANAGEIKQFSESYTDTVKVSGQLLKGLQYETDSLELKPYTYFRQPFKGIICAEVSSIDGRYRSSFQVEFLEAAQGATPVPFPTRYQSQLEAFKQSELAILFWYSDNCESTKKDYLIGSWGPIDSNPSVQLLIRSDARRDVLTVSKKYDINKFQSKCTPIDSAYTVSFDKRCSLKNINSYTTKTIILKRRNLRALPDIFIPLLFETKE